MMKETIAAIATAPGPAGIAVIRLSGGCARQIADKVIKLSGTRKIAEMRGYTCAFGYVMDEGERVDEVVATVFHAPHSYTGEDVVELAVHGGAYLPARVLRVCCQAGARLALAGEFTKRAFLNGKLDLTQAEAVIDLISAQGEKAAHAAMAAKDGALFKKADQIGRRLIDAAAGIAAWIDYPEEDITPEEDGQLQMVLGQCLDGLQALLATYDTGAVIREGIETAIVGRPNAGKSTLMNLLARADRSIVSEIAGTTRDVVCETVRLGDVLLRLSDTAGIHVTEDPIEQAGVTRAKDRIKKAQLVLAVFDGSDQLNENDRKVIEQCDGATAIAVVNKNDLTQKLDLQILKRSFHHVVTISAKYEQGAADLEHEIMEMFAIGAFDANAAMIANERQRARVLMSVQSLKEAIEALQSGVSYDAVCVCIEEAAGQLLELTGQKASQEVIDQVFSRFCVGK